MQQPGTGSRPAAPAAPVAAAGQAGPGHAATDHPVPGGTVPDHPAAAIRASDAQRDGTVQRLQAAFAEGRLDDAEFNERARAALSARTHADLDRLVTDLPAAGAGRPGTVVAGAQAAPGRLSVGYKGAVRRAGRWRVPEKYTAVVYKGSGWLDLRAAELTGPVTTLLTVAYKSRVTILVPPASGWKPAAWAPRPTSTPACRCLPAPR